MKRINRWDLFTLVINCVKVVSGVIGASIVLSEKHPILAISVLAIGAAANEIAQFLKAREYKKVIKEKDEEAA